jgi:hypothetical protein
VAASKGDSAKLERIQSSIDQLQQCSEEAFIWIAQRRILKSLEFEGMYGRFDMVDKAHSKTFQWIFHSPGESDVEDGVGSGEDNPSRASEESEPEWSQSGWSSNEDEDDRESRDGDNQSVDDGDRSTGPEVEASDDETGQLSEDRPQHDDYIYESEDGNDDQSDHDERQSDADSHQSGDVKDDSSLNDKGQVCKRSQQLMTEDTTRRHARELFINWLSSGDGIFHISGKLGSGKSTLMKFLHNHRRTKTELKKWAGELMYSYSIVTSLDALLTFFVRRENTRIRKLLLLGARLGAAKVAWRPLLCPPPRHTRVMAQHDTRGVT